MPSISLNAAAEKTGAPAGTVAGLGKRPILRSQRPFPEFCQSLSFRSFNQNRPKPKNQNHHPLADATALQQPDAPI
jgi:hypothetical protein